MVLSKKEEKRLFRLALGVLVVGAYLYILMKGVQKLERRRLMVVGGAEDGAEGNVFLFIVFFAFVGTLLVLGG